MREQHIAKISEELELKPKQVLATAALLDEGATVPFVARYRKEATGSLDEVAITAIRDRLHQLDELDKRREAVLKSLHERELLTDELQNKILAIPLPATNVAKDPVKWLFVSVIYFTHSLHSVNPFLILLRL